MMLVFRYSFQDVHDSPTWLSMTVTSRFITMRDTLTALRSRFWVTKGRQTVKTAVGNGSVCKKLWGDAMRQMFLLEKWGTRVSRLLSWIPIKIDLLSWLCRVMRFIRKDRGCHVDFVCFYPPRIELRKWEGMRESCLVYSSSGIQSLFEVDLLYTFYTNRLGSIVV